jgi:hypothetical protein
MTKSMRSWRTYVIGGIASVAASWTITVAPVTPSKYVVPVLSTITIFLLGAEIRRLQTRAEVDPVLGS